MSRNNENKLVPTLRFPEFKNDGVWKGDELGKLSVFFKGKGLAKNDIVNGGKNPCVHYGELFTKYSEIINEIKSYTNISGGFKSEVNDVLMPTSDVTPNGLAKASCIKLDGIILGGDILIIRPNPNIYGEFLSRFIRHRERDVLKLVSGTTVFHLYGSSFEKFRLLYPLIKEQRKIATCLSSLDEVISAESQKLDILKDQKKGLLQNLFPQEGETVPKFRFKEFEDSGDWEEKVVKDYFTVGSSKRVLQHYWTNQGVPFYRTRELVSLSKNEPFGSEVFISEELYSELKQTYGVPEEGDFLVSGVGTLGICYQVKNGDKFYFKDGNVLWFRLEGGLDSTYFKYCFQSEHIQNQIVGQSSKSTVGTYTIQNAKKTKLWYPPAIKEQEKIAYTLSSIDDLINAQTQQVESLNYHKKGLLQGLFPRING